MKTRRKQPPASRIEDIRKLNALAHVMRRPDTHYRQAHCASWHSSLLVTGHVPALRSGEPLLELTAQTAP